MNYELIYRIAKEVIDGRLTRDEAAIQINTSTCMTISTAKIHISDLIDMYRGNAYSRTISKEATKYFIDNLKRDYGEYIFNNAILATKGHVQYYNSLGSGKRNCIEKLLMTYSI